MPDYESTARALKAERLADTLYGLGRQGGIEITSGYVTELRGKVTLRTQVERVAGIRVPASSLTWDVVVDIVRRRGSCWPHDLPDHDVTCRRCGYNLITGNCAVRVDAAPREGLVFGPTDRQGGVHQ